jgi:hypothetical protein
VPVLQGDLSRIGAWLDVGLNRFVLWHSFKCYEIYCDNACNSKHTKTQDARYRLPRLFIARGRKLSMINQTLRGLSAD